MAESCGHTNQHGVKCGLPPHKADTPHELTQQLCPPSPFIIKATDPFALAIVRAWITVAKVCGVSAHKLAQAEDWYYQARRWQVANGTKIPD